MNSHQLLTSMGTGVKLPPQTVSCRRKKWFPRTSLNANLSNSLVTSLVRSQEISPTADVRGPTSTSSSTCLRRTLTTTIHLRALPFLPTMSGSLDSLEHWSRQQPALPSSSVIFRHPRLLSGGHVAFPRRVQDFTPKPQKGSSHPLRVNHLSAAYNEADGTLVACSAGEDWCSLRRCEKFRYQARSEESTHTSGT